MNSLLIVDDDLEVLDLLKKFFVQHGYRVEVATDGASLWAAIERQAPDLIILDVMLPGDSGLILCQQPNRLLAEYALRGVDSPIGVSGFELTRALPENLQTSLPSIEQIESELGDFAE